MRKLILITLFISSRIVFGGQPDIRLNIKLVHDSKAEQTGRDLLLSFTKEYDLSKYIFTHDIIIESKVIPHSHPVLTLNTRTINDPDQYLSAFLHEEIHWFFASKDDKSVNKFVEMMKREFPNAPVGIANGGAENEFSTYLHLGVCYYEFQALSHFIGEEKARKIFETEEVYPWVRKQVLYKADKIHGALKETALIL